MSMPMNLFFDTFTSCPEDLACMILFKMKISWPSASIIKNQSVICDVSLKHAMLKAESVGHSKSGVNIQWLTYLNSVQINT